MPRRRYARGGTRRATTGYRRTSRKRTRKTSRARQPKIVIQLVTNPGGVAMSPYTLGKKGDRVVRARY